MAAALRHAATRLGGGGPLRRMQVEQRRLASSSTVAKRPVTEAEKAHVINRLNQIDEKKEELYSMIADLTKSYILPWRITYRHEMLMDQLAAQVQPRPDDQLWRTCRRAQKLGDFSHYVGVFTLGAGTVYGVHWAIEQIDPKINESIAAEVNRLRDKILD